MTGIIILLIILGLLLIGVGFLIFWEIKKRNDFNVVAHFITSDKKEKRKSYKSIQERFSFKDETYFYDDKCAITRGKKKHIFYLKGNSNPINFELSNNELSLKYNSKTIDQMLENDLIQKLLSDIDDTKKQEQRIILYLVFTVIIILFGVYYIINNASSSEVILTSNNQTIEVIKQAVMEAIKG